MKRIPDRARDIFLGDGYGLFKGQTQRNVRRDRCGVGATGSVSQNPMLVWLGELIHPVAIDQDIDSFG